MHTTPTLAGGNAKKREISRPFAWVADWRELQLAAAVTSARLGGVLANLTVDYNMKGFR